MVKILRDLGEREIVKYILPRFTSGIGDDCAILNLPDLNLIVTSDPVPEPASKLIGGDPDPYWMGWLLVVINASDLAAAGASPLAFLAAIEAPASLPIEDFERFLLGISEACKAEGLAYVGGNLREATKFSAVGTAIGHCKPGKAIRRKCAKGGDLIVSIGQGGLFWRDALFVKQGENILNKNLSPLYRPNSQLKAMSLLAQEGLISAAMDNSDGLLPTLVQLATENSTTIQLDLSNLSIPASTIKSDYDPARLWLGWGDWNVITVINQNSIENVSQIASSVGSIAIPIGKLGVGTSIVELVRQSKSQPAPRLESERFAKDSWFEIGVQKYIDLLLNLDIP